MILDMSQKENKRQWTFFSGATGHYAGHVCFCRVLGKFPEMPADPLNC